MRIRDLIEQLQEYDEELTVVFTGDDWTDLIEPDSLTIVYGKRYEQNNYGFHWRDDGQKLLYIS